MKTFEELVDKYENQFHKLIAFHGSQFEPITIETLSKAIETGKPLKVYDDKDLLY